MGLYYRPCKRQPIRTQYHWHSPGILIVNSDEGRGILCVSIVGHVICFQPMTVQHFWW